MRKKHASQTKIQRQSKRKQRKRIPSSVPRLRSASAPRQSKTSFTKNLISRLATLQGTPPTRHIHCQQHRNKILLCLMCSASWSSKGTLQKRAKIRSSSKKKVDIKQNNLFLFRSLRRLAEIDCPLDYSQVC
jgi:hypothetical protein